MTDGVRWRASNALDPFPWTNKIWRNGAWNDYDDYNPTVLDLWINIDDGGTSNYWVPEGWKETSPKIFTDGKSITGDG
jgi:hypothetical protein